MVLKRWRIWLKGQPESTGVEVSADTAFNANKEVGPQLGNPPFSGVQCREIPTPPPKAPAARPKRKAPAKRSGKRGQKRKTTR